MQDNTKIRQRRWFVTHCDSRHKNFFFSDLDEMSTIIVTHIRMVDGYHKKTVDFMESPIAVEEGGSRAMNLRMVSTTVGRSTIFDG